MPSAAQSRRRCTCECVITYEEKQGVAPEHHAVHRVDDLDAGNRFVLGVQHRHTEHLGGPEASQFVHSRVEALVLIAAHTDTSEDKDGTAKMEGYQSAILMSCLFKIQAPAMEFMVRGMRISCLVSFSLPSIIKYNSFRW